MGGDTLLSGEVCVGWNKCTARRAFVEAGSTGECGGSVAGSIGGLWGQEGITGGGQ